MASQTKMGLAKHYKFADGVSVSKLGNVFLIKQKNQLLSLDPENQAHWSVVEALSSGTQKDKHERQVFSKENQDALEELERMNLISSGVRTEVLKPTKVFLAQGSDIIGRESLPINIEFEEEEARADLSVLIQTQNSLTERIEFCKSLAQQSKPGLVAFVDWQEFRVGPFVIPGETACENCLVHRSAAWAPSPDLQASVGNAIVDRQADPGTVGIVRSMVHAQITNFHNGVLTGCLYNKVLFGSVINWAFEMHDVHRFPFCRICATKP